MIARKTAPITSASQRRRAGRATEAEQAERQQRPVQRLPERVAHHAAGAVRPDPADLGGDEAGVFERLFARGRPRAVPCPSSRAPVGVPARVAGAASRPRICSSRSRSTAWRAEQRRSRVFGDHLRADLFRVAARRAGRCPRRAPARRRSRPARSRRARRVAHGPGQRPRRAAARAPPRSAASPSRRHRSPRGAPGARGTDASEGGRSDDERQVLGADQGRARRAATRQQPAATGALAVRAPRASPAPRRRAASPPAARSSASRCTRASPGRSRRAHAPRDQARRAAVPGEPPPRRSGRRRGPPATPISARTTRARRSCDAAGHLVERRRRTAAGPGSSCSRAGSRAGPDGEAVAASRLAAIAA